MRRSAPPTCIVRRATSRAAAALVASLALAAGAGARTTFHVDAAAAPGGDGSPAAPFDTIQEGLDATAGGDTVLVAPGEYVESLVAPVHAFLLTSEGGPLVTTLRAAAGEFEAALAFPSPPSSPLQAVQGLTIRDGYYGVFDESFSSRLERCIVTGNEVGVRSAGIALERCTVVGNAIGIQDSTLGVVCGRSIVHGNHDWDYTNVTLHALGQIQQCVGFEKVHDVVGSSFVDVLFGDPALWDPGSGDVHLAPGSPCIGYAGGLDVGALDFDPAYGAAYVDLGAALAGRGGAPTLDGAGILYPGQTISLTIAGGAPLAFGWLIVGFDELSLPLLGGTLVPTPDVLAPAPLDGDGGLVGSVVWPDGLPPGFTLHAQAWIPDAGGPQGYAATNGLSFTAP